jgi:replicative DNA helicase
MKDRLPPYDADAEKAVMGCCLTTPAESIPETGLVVTCGEFFYDERCAVLWRIISAMPAREVNIITVAGKMSGPRQLAMSFLMECQDLAFSSANLPVWLATVQDKFILRQIIATATQAAQAAYKANDATAALDAFESAALKIRPQRGEQTDIRTLIRQATDLIETRSQNWDKITGLETGLVDLDKLTDGLHPGEFVIPAAKPSVGKTALSVNIAIHNAMRGVPVGIISAEMRPVQLVIRSICSQSRVNFKRMGNEDIARMIPHASALAAAPIYIQQANGFTIGQAQACARRWAQRYGIKMLVADYIQRFQGQGDNRELQVASVGAGFKNIALELGIPVVAPSQLNDEGMLRESRALGQDADSVWVLKNDGVWKHDTQPVKLRVDKCRDGETGEVDLIFHKIWTRFESRSLHDDDWARPYAD